MRGERSVSIIITNHDYGRFVGAAIRSALEQTYAPVEVIVVDDGSTDDSAAVISRFGDSVVAIEKERGGQASAFHAGFARSGGDVVVFLDADDVLMPRAVEEAVRCFDDPEVVKVHWPPLHIDEDGTPRPGRARALPGGDFRRTVLQTGPTNVRSAPTSCNAWLRAFLETVLPMPERLYEICADTYLFELAPFLGTIRAIDEPLTAYRHHGTNRYDSAPAERRIELQLRFYDNCCEELRRLGFEFDENEWRAHSWWHRLQGAYAEIARLPHPDRPLILVDDDAWEPGAIAGRQRIPFLEAHGVYAGAPEDDETAIRALERLRRAHEPGLIVFAWASFWWLEHYPEFRVYLTSRYPTLVANERIVVFELS